MVYDIQNYDPMAGQGFNIGEFGAAIGDTLQSAVENVGGNFDANTANALAIANLNKAQADAIRSNAENRRQMTKNIFTFLVICVIALTVVVLAKKFIK